MRKTRIVEKIVAPRTCSVCGDPFTPRFVSQWTCPGRCSRVAGGRKGVEQKTAALMKVVAQRKVEAKRKVEELCHTRWPELSVREIEIFNFAVRYGYKLGYKAGLGHQRRAARATALEAEVVAS